MHRNNSCKFLNFRVFLAGYMVINVPFIEPFHAHSPFVTVLEKETLESPSVSWFRFSLSGVCLCDPYWELVCWIGQISSTSLHWFTKSGNKLLHAHQHIITDTCSHKYVIHVHTLALLEYCYSGGNRERPVYPRAPEGEGLWLRANGSL